MKEVAYMTGLGRGNSGYELLDETHIYACDELYQPSRPLCKRGFNRDWGGGFSIFRGNIGDLGLCPVCEARKLKGHKGISWKRSRRLKKRINKMVAANNYTPLLPGLPLMPD